MNKIQQQWNVTNFDIAAYKKGNDFRGWTIKSPEEVRQILEDNIMILQSVSASKYNKSVRSKVTQWEQDLNTVSDAIELWMIVQRNWMYLEGIFASEDIRIQLPEEAKKFSKTDNNYKEIMKKT